MTRISRAQSATWREIDGQVVVISVDSARVRLLNAVGGFIWSRCDGRPIGQIVDDVLETYEIDAALARADVESFVRDMSSRGMIVVEA